MMEVSKIENTQNMILHRVERSSLHSVSGMRRAAENCVSALSFLLFAVNPLSWASPRLFCISDSSVDKALLELKKAHLISVEHQYTRDGRQTSNRYKLYDIEEQFRKVFCAEELEAESEKELRERFPELFEDDELP